MQRPSSANVDPPHGSWKATPPRRVSPSRKVASPRHDNRHPRWVLMPNRAITGRPEGRTRNTRAFLCLAPGSVTSSCIGTHGSEKTTEREAGRDRARRLVGVERCDPAALALEQL